MGRAILTATPIWSRRLRANQSPWCLSRAATAWSACASTLILLAASMVPAYGQEPESLGCGLAAGPSRAVARVIDGATLELDDRTQVRLSGLLTPRASDVGATPGSWPPEEAARAALEALVQGRSIALAYAGPSRDRHNRAVAHVFVRGGERAAWVQAQIVEAGHARVFAGPGSEACLPALLDREATARAAGRGLWSHAAYYLRRADRPSEIAPYAGSFQLVAGRVSKVRRTRSLVIVDFDRGEAKGRGFRVIAASGGAAGRQIDDHGNFLNAEVVVRGWIGDGPEIELLGLHQLVTAAHPSGDAKRPADEPPGAEKR